MTDFHHKDFEFKWAHVGICDFGVKYEGQNGATILILWINQYG